MRLLLLASLLGSSIAFLNSSPQYRPLLHHKTTTSIQSTTNDEEPTSNRRSFIGKSLAGAAAVGLVANKVAIEGPSPYMPPPNSLTGKVIVITGGNTGLGLESGKRLAAAGATIVVTTRSIEKGAKAVEAIKEYTKENNGIENDYIYSLPLDLCNLESVKNFPELLKNSPALANNGKIDILMNNAGVMAIPDLQLTKDGYERTFQTNHLGHFALTAGLMPFMNMDGTDDARVINVSSSAYQISAKGLDLDNLNGEKEYGPWSSYGNSKIENILFTKELDRRAKASGKKLTSIALHPGAVRTELQRYIVGEEKNKEMESGNVGLLDRLIIGIGVYFTKAVDRGATTQIWLASGQGGNGVGGKFYQNCQELPLADGAKDMDTAAKLWDISEKLSGVKFSF